MTRLRGEDSERRCTDFGRGANAMSASLGDLLV